MQCKGQWHVTLQSRLQLKCTETKVKWVLLSFQSFCVTDVRCNHKRLKHCNSYIFCSSPFCLHSECAAYPPPKIFRSFTMELPHTRVPGYLSERSCLWPTTLCSGKLSNAAMIDNQISLWANCCGQRLANSARWKAGLLSARTPEAR